MPQTTPRPKTSAQGEKTRRRPTQARSQNTLQTLFKAAAQILDKHGEAGLSTNKVAAQAGFSIGTLYQYFPHKEALIHAMAQRGQALVRQQLEDFFLALESDPDVSRLPVPELFERLVRILVQGLASGKNLNQSLIRLCWSVERPEETASTVRQMADRLGIFLERIQHPDIGPVSHATLFVLTRSVIGTLRSASLEKSPLLRSHALEGPLTRLAVALLMRT